MMLINVDVLKEKMYDFLKSYEPSELLKLVQEAVELWEEDEDE